MVILFVWSYDKIFIFNGVMFWVGKCYLCYLQVEKCFETNLGCGKRIHSKF